MYRINRLMRNVLITTDEVIYHAPTKHSLDPRAVEQSIIIAEERLIRTALTDDLYYAIADEKNREVTSSNKAATEQLINSSLPEGSEPITLNEGEIVNAMEFLSPNNLKLWKQHLWKLTAECVMLGSTPEAYVQFGAEGVIHTVPAAGPMNTTGLVSPELRSVKWLMDKKMMDRIDPLTEAMHAWICRNKSSYPLYARDCGCDSKGVAYKRKSDIVLGLYDDIDNINSCGCYED